MRRFHRRNRNPRVYGRLAIAQINQTVEPRRRFRLAKNFKNRTGRLADMMNQFFRRQFMTWLRTVGITIAVLAFPFSTSVI
ncbi:MAG: hypothetical protein V8T87_06210 [Victivallales bacterium]